MAEAKHSELAEGFDGSTVRVGPNHSTIEIWYDTEAQARSAHGVIVQMIDEALTSDAQECCEGQGTCAHSCAWGRGWDAAMKQGVAAVRVPAISQPVTVEKWPTLPEAIALYADPQRTEHEALQGKFTPGPWKVVARNRAREFNQAAIRQDGTHLDFPLTIAAVNAPMHEEGMANANLIAAAPELFAAAQDFVEILRKINGFCECGAPECRTTRLRAAIAKATS